MRGKISCFYPPLVFFKTKNLLWFQLLSDTKMTTINLRPFVNLVQFHISLKGDRCYNIGALSHYVFLQYLLSALVNAYLYNLIRSTVDVMKMKMHAWVEESAKEDLSVLISTTAVHKQADKDGENSGDFENPLEEILMNKRAVNIFFLHLHFTSIMKPKKVLKVKEHFFLDFVKSFFQIPINIYWLKCRSLFIQICFQYLLCFYNMAHLL